jgi:hypothetical protein
MTAATDASINASAATARRKQIRRCLLMLDVMAGDHPNRGAVILELAMLMGIPTDLPGGQLMERLHDAIGHLNRTTPRPWRIEVCAGHRASTYHCAMDGRGPPTCARARAAPGLALKSRPSTTALLCERHWPLCTVIHSKRHQAPQKCRR